MRTITKVKGETAYRCELGNLEGKRLYTLSPERKSCADPVGVSVIVWGDYVIPIDSGHLPGSVARLVPMAWSRAKANDWHLFVNRAWQLQCGAELA